MKIFYLNTISLISIIMMSLSGYTQTGVLKGKVSGTEDVLQAATVTLGSKTMLTDYKGEFLFTVNPGIYTLIITHSGYRKMEQEVKIEADSTHNLDFRLIDIDQLDEVVIGSRSTIRRSNLDRPVPVDIITSKQLWQTGQISLTQMLNFVAPSFNVSREILNEPVTLRGLDPQHLLISLNNVRYHNLAWYFGGALKGQLGKGSVGNDLNSIPVSAIDEIEILRDGASAQYGSDAIAGVLNIKLKKTTGKTTIQSHIGQYYENDGEKFSIGLYHGIALCKKGFLSISANFRYQEPTFRGGAYEGTIYYDTTNKSAGEKDSLLELDNQKVAKNGFNRRAAVDNIGNSKWITYGLLINGGYNLNVKTEFFWTASFNERKVERLMAYRFPKNRKQVNTILYPDGFQPVSKPGTIDGTFLAGIKGETIKNWHWNISTSFGINSVKNHVINSINPTQSFMGAEAQTSFYTGTDTYKLITTGVNFSKRYDNPGEFLKRLNLAWGTEWRLENYISKIGEEASWYNYDPANYTQAGPGAGPENAVNKNRNVLAAYIELEAEPAKRILVNIASRFEYYSDYGGNIGAKIAALYKLLKKLSLKASVNNGFRAPSLQQRYTTSIQQSVINRNGALIPAYKGLFANDHIVAKAFEIPLTPEKSINISGGITAAIFKNISLMVDAYWIQIKDRIILSGTLDTNNMDVKSILNSIPGIRVDQVQFFTNAINTKTKGTDIVLNGKWNINKGYLDFTFAANFTETRLYGEIKATDKLPVNALNTNSLFNKEEKTRIEYGQPANKFILSFNGKKGKTRFALTNTRFGNTKTSTLIDSKNYIFLEELFSSKILTDVNINYDLKKWLTLTIGANNVFNVYPDRIKNHENTLQGVLIYSPEASPFAFNGGYYYIGMSLNW